MAVNDWALYVSTQEVYRDEDMTHSLESDLVAIETALTNKAAANHSHTEYAASTHTHDEYAASSHAHTEYAASAHTHTEYAASAHTHDAYAVASHNHDTEYIDKALQCVNDSGGVKYSYGADSGKDLLAEILAMPQGMHTSYSIAGTSGNPKTTESWRCLIHKTAANFGWVIAFGNTGSIYTNYLDTGVWNGWKAIFEPNPAPLWTGSWYVNAAQTVTPSKPLEQCRNGWMLVWSDYDTTGGAAVNSEACVTFIPKRNFTGAKWTGQSHLMVVPASVTNDADAITLKRVQVYDGYFTGHAVNAVAPRNDVALRAVYEF